MKKAAKKKTAKKFKPRPVRTIGYCLAIDPGQNGGMAVFRGRECCAFWPISGSTEYQILQRIRDYTHEYYPLSVVLERAQSMPRQGVVSAFKYGAHYGFLRGVCMGLNLPIEDMRPQDWQKLIKIPPRKKNEGKPQFKKRLLAKAQQLFPSASWNNLSIGHQLAIADALLIGFAASKTQ